jgi:inorganic pyrophosphatase
MRRLSLTGVMMRARRTITTAATGEANTTSYRIFFSRDGKRISPWHDISLNAAPRDGERDLFNFISEIPKFGTAKMEVQTKEQHNPIGQDIKKGKLRHYHGPIYWNYGCFPQTWEDPGTIHPELRTVGDNDPLDVVEIGTKALSTGSVTPVKVLGVLGLIDDGEVDWKIISINSSDAMASKVHDIPDVEKHMPGVISGIREWFRWYKTPDNKPLNKFGFDDKCLHRKQAIEVVHETHKQYQSLILRKSTSDRLWTGRE